MGKTAKHSKDVFDSGLSCVWLPIIHQNAAFSFTCAIELSSIMNSTVKLAALSEQSALKYSANTFALVGWGWQNHQICLRLDVANVKWC